MQKRLLSVRRLFLLLAISALPTLVSGQLLAKLKSQPVQQRAEPQRAMKLKEMLLLLKAKYQVDLLFEEKILPEVLVPGNAIRSGASFETNLKTLLGTTGIQFRKVKKGTYVLLEQKRTREFMKPEPLVPGQPEAHKQDLPTIPSGAEAGKEHLSPTRIAPNEITIKGKVFDTHEPPRELPGVTIAIKGTNEGASTDENGYFALDVPRDAVLVFTMVGHKSVEYVAKSANSNLIIALQEEIASLDEAIVVGQTEQKKKHIAGSIATVNVASQISGKPITTLSQSLQGGVTGLQVQQSSGMPGGDAAAIKIRGISTLGNSDPLILVDGIPMDMNHIDPVTVESVTVLKDAAASAMYGARAANGVILVTTRRGTPGKISVTYDGYVGSQSPTYLQKLVDAPQYMRMYNEARVNSGNQPFYTDEVIQKTADGSDPIMYPNTDWVDLIVRENSPITSHSISLDGGNNLARFAVTANYMYQDGMIPLSKMDRFNIRANTSITVNKRFVFDVDLLAIKRNTRNNTRPDANQGNRMLEDVYRVPPTILPKYPEKNGRTMYGRYADIVNPLAYAERGGYRDFESGQALINIQPKWEVFPDFNVKGQFSFRLNSDQDRTIADAYNFFDYGTNQLVQSWGVQRGASFARGTYMYMAANADYTFTKNDHRLYAFGGFSTEKNSSGYWDVNTMVSGYTKLNYSFKDKYLLEATARMDGSSKFGPGHQWGFFPSAAIGWNMHQEEFLKNVRGINNLKLRASYGLLGNENIGLYRFQTLVQGTNGYENIWGNPDITWETVGLFDVGIDVGLFNNSLELIFDYYDKVTKDIILQPQVSFVGGMGNVPINAGKVRNRGWELSLNYFKELSKNWNLSVKPGVSYNQNRILELQNGPYLTSTTINQEGRPISSIYGYRTGGLLQQGDFNESGAPQVPAVVGAKPGDIRYLDLNGNGQIDAQDQEAIGNPVPMVNYFTNVRLAHKKFDIEMLIQGTGKSDQRLTGMLAYPLDQTADGGVPTTYYADRYWTPERTDARFPRLSNTPANNKLSSDFWIQNGAYCRVKYIQLGYNLPVKAVRKVGAMGARLYVNAQNPFVFTPMKLMDPESLGNQWTYGIMKVYTVGINVKF
ncbi:TonB-dependent receptor P3 [Dyadobacter sp. CECT 9623]|uniref:TonB-dependent receptor P3 n=1 Tax=Dyadobacter linearis TaxID=2823330 RepID=A0ABM8UIM5_9BACT|nr:TonB-dependent receptor [Dyadobacter sp. CECT 9623]CAG5067349.1 TonB-dependent receptor P3 [Dyadobacter sp. CECT 9623]